MARASRKALHARRLGGWGMTDLLLQPAADSEGQLSNFDFDALPVANRWVASPRDAAGLMWFWAIDASLRGDRDRTEGHERHGRRGPIDAPIKHQTSACGRFQYLRVGYGAIFL